MPGAGGPRRRRRVRQAVHEFLFFPAFVVAGWLVCAGVAIAFDRGLVGGARAVVGALATVLPPQSTTSLLENVVAGLITMISIVFFVLVMAVQHQSSIYSPVVFDQFLRRRSNQAFFGVLIGQTAYCLLVLTLVPSGQTVLSGAVALVGVVATVVLLLAFIYSTVDQMRPSAIVWMIQHLALRARAGQQPLLARCRTEVTLTDADALPVYTDAAGYIVHIDGHRLATALDRVPDEHEVEIEFVLVMGDHVVPGELLARVRGGDRDTRDELAEQVLAALSLGRMPDIDRDAGHAVDHLGNMAWSAAAGHDPEGARVAIRNMHNLLAHWSHQPEPSAESYGGNLPIVYNDRVVTKLLDALTSAVAAAAPAWQHQTCSYALRALAEVLPRLSPHDQEAAVDRLHRVLPATARHLYTREVEQALDSVRAALNSIGRAGDRDRVGEIQQQLAHEHRLADPADPTTDGAPRPHRTGTAQLR